MPEKQTAWKEGEEEWLQRLQLEEWGPSQQCVIVQAHVHLPSMHFQRPAAKSLLETSLHSICKAHVLLENTPTPGRERGVTSAATLLSTINTGLYQLTCQFFQ